METKRGRKIRTERHVKRMAVDLYRNSEATLGQAGRARGRSPGTMGHYFTDVADPKLRSILTDLITGLVREGVSPAVVLANATEAYELHYIVPADTATLTERCLYLLEWENEAGAREDQAAMVGKGEHAKWLRVVASASAELASLLDELRYRNVDAHELFRARRAA